MWHLIYDARPMEQEHTGLGRYTASLLLGLLESSTASDCQVDVLIHESPNINMNAHVAKIEAAVQRRGGARIHRVPVPAISIRQHWKLARFIRRFCADHYFYPHFDRPLGIHLPSTFVVHDLIPLKVPGYVQRVAWLKKHYFKELIRMNVRWSHRCIAVSETTRNDVLELVGPTYAGKVDVVYEGTLTSSRERDIKPLITSPYLLYVGDRRPHKNVQRIIDLFVALKDQHGYVGILVLVGNKRNYGFNVEQYVVDREDVVFVGNVSDEDLSWYYEHTDCLMFLSEYEGFGLPVIEAARFNRKIVVSDGGALAEIAPKSSCVIARRLTIQQAAAKVAEYLSNPEQVNLTTYLAQFTWSIAAKRIFPQAYPESRFGI
jgi:glycosyltransferase involved in cell wall biosynthesis